MPDMRACEVDPDIAGSLPAVYVPRRTPETAVGLAFRLQRAAGRPQSPAAARALHSRPCRSLPRRPRPQDRSRTAGRVAEMTGGVTASAVRCMGQWHGVSCSGETAVRRLCCSRSDRSIRSSPLSWLAAALSAAALAAGGLLLGVVTPAGAATARPPTETLGPSKGWRWPLAGRPVVLRRFDAPAGPYAAGHRGVDLGISAGSPVLAAGGGIVVFAGLVAGRGVVSVQHGRLRTTYEPVLATVRPGQPVDAGMRLGTLTAGIHCGVGRSCLHWGLRRGDTYLDPLLLVGAGPVRLLPVWGAAAPAAGPASTERHEQHGRPHEESRVPAGEPVEPAAGRAQSGDDRRPRPSSPVAVEEQRPDRAAGPKQEHAALAGTTGLALGAGALGAGALWAGRHGRRQNAAPS